VGARDVPTTIPALMPCLEQLVGRFKASVPDDQLASIVARASDIKAVA